MQEPIDLGEAAENAMVGALCLGATNGIRHIPSAGRKVLIAARFRLAVPQRLVFEPDRGEFGDVLEADDDMAQVGNRSMAIVEIELVPEFFRRMAMHPAKAVLNGVGRAAVAGQGVGRLLWRHRCERDDAAGRLIDTHETFPDKNIGRELYARAPVCARRCGGIHQPSFADNRSRGRWSAVPTRLTYDAPLRVDMPRTRRYSPESFMIVAAYGHDQGH